MNLTDLSAYSGKRVAVGLSGGVDSSVALLLLHQAGVEVLGITMKIYGAAVPNLPANIDACYGPGEAEDIDACQRLCDRYGIPYQALDLVSEYEERILEYFKAEYQAGRTPNPCVRCNTEMKFGFLLDRAREAGHEFDFFATGHYARTVSHHGRIHLQTAVDVAKDQTYFLHRLGPDALSRVLFPLGGLTKPEVKHFAREHGLADIADKAESQDFIGGDYSVLFGSSEPGDIVDESGQVLGRHRGIIHYTVGQRRGLGMSLGPKPMYVLSLDAAANRVVVSDNADLFATGLQGGSAFVHLPELAAGSFDAMVRIRQNHRPVLSRVRMDGERATVEFDSPQRAVAPGQSAVFYSPEGVVLGGCVIDTSIRLPA